jgi:hypothetical protein
MNNVLEELKDSALYLARCRYLGKILEQYCPSPLKKYYSPTPLRSPSPSRSVFFTSLLCRPIHTLTHSLNEPGCPHRWGLNVTLRHTPHSVRLFWTSDRPVAQIPT